MMFEQFELLFVNEAAVLLRVSDMTIYKLIHNGELEAFKVGRAWKIQRQSVLHYIERQRKTIH